MWKLFLKSATSEWQNGRYVRPPCCPLSPHPLLPGQEQEWRDAKKAKNRVPDLPVQHFGACKYPSWVFSLPFASIASLRLKVGLTAGEQKRGPRYHANVDHCPHILRKALYFCVFWKMRGMSQILKTLQTRHILRKNDRSTDNRVHVSNLSFRGTERINLDF